MITHVHDMRILTMLFKKSSSNSWTGCFFCFQELREHFENEAKQENRTCLLLSATVPAIKSHIDNGYSALNLSRYCSPTRCTKFYVHNGIFCDIRRTTGQSEMLDFN